MEQLSLFYTCGNTAGDFVHTWDNTAGWWWNPLVTIVYPAIISPSAPIRISPFVFPEGEGHIDIDLGKLDLSKLVKVPKEKKYRRLLRPIIDKEEK